MAKLTADPCTGESSSKLPSNATFVLTANAIKNHLGLELSDDELRVEDAYKRGANGIEKATA